MSSVWPSLYEKIVDRLRTRHVKDKVIQKLLHGIIEDFDQQTTTGILLKLLCYVWAGAWFSKSVNIFPKIISTVSRICDKIILCQIVNDLRCKQQVSTGGSSLAV